MPPENLMARLLMGPQVPTAQPQQGGFLPLSSPNVQSALSRNTPYLSPSAGNSYNTKLSPLEELMFRGWVQQNRVPFNADAVVTDYDMRGFWRGLQTGDPRASSSVNPNDNQMHYPDYWKTPHHQTFSQDSQWAGPTAPQWNAQDQLVSPSGRILFDERAPNKR